MNILQNEFNFALKFNDKFTKIGTYYPISWFYTDKELKINRFCIDGKSYLLVFNKHIKRIKK
jgi:hypothetical protein